LDDFPLTLRDAIKTARILGMSYIWIDSICIVQDSIEDWEEESSQMDKVYGQAELVVAASAAQYSDDGFLNERRILPHGSISVPVDKEIVPRTVSLRVLSQTLCGTPPSTRK
jgi:hypothetical protein